MALFGFGKKKEKEESCCCCCDCGSEAVQSVVERNGDELQNIKVLGAGCSSCHEQLKYVKEAVKNLQLGIEVEYITDLEKIMGYGVMSMPAIVINGKVVSAGKVLKVDAAEKLIKECII